MNWRNLKKLITFTLTFVFFYIFCSIPANYLLASPKPWETDKNELSLQGLYLGSKQQLIQIKYQERIITYSYEPDALFALMGLYSGTLLDLAEFPCEIPVQIILTKSGTIRAMRNIIEHHPPTQGEFLSNFGHYATLNPNEEYYTIYDYLKGLSLYNLKDPQAPVSLSSLPLCAWNNEGTKLAYADNYFLGIYAPQEKNNKRYFFPNNNLGTVRIVTSLAFNPQDDRLFYSFLEDYPQQGSNVFQLNVLDMKGNTLATKVVENLGPACWLSQNIIVFVLNPSESELGKIVLWNYRFNKTRLLLNFQGYCQNLCVNYQTNTLAYAIAQETNWQEELSLYDLTTNKATMIKSFISPLHHLQWTKDNLLIFWDEINNTITILNEKGELIKKTSGFLPEKSVAKNFLFFPEKPISEALPLYLSNYKPATKVN